MEIAWNKIYFSFFSLFSSCTIEKLRASRANSECYKEQRHFTCSDIFVWILIIRVFHISFISTISFFLLSRKFFLWLFFCVLKSTLVILLKLSSQIQLKCTFSPSVTVLFRFDSSVIIPFASFFLLFRNPE